ncbi:MAG TPA: MarR family transcriptional regulator [Gemmataceae bacterium]|nr:MarR family transcriptional regulator [Gemmataceae bacterium]
MVTQRTVNGSSPNRKSAENAFREMIRVFGLLERVMQPYFARFGISGAQWGVLRNLHRAEQEGISALRLTDLSERLLVRPPSVAGVVERLERSGLVARHNSETDLRAKLVSLTPKGRQLLDQVLAVHGKQIESILGVLEPEEQVQLHDMFHRLVQHLEGLATRNVAFST